MTPGEERGVLRAGERAGVMGVVGANLGRVPEFTSKVVHTLNAHHLHGRVRAAAAHLLATTPNLAHINPARARPLPK